MEERMDRLKGKVVLISGGARGQGAAEARLFAAEGARVVIGDVLEQDGRQLASELGHAAAFVRQDVTQESDPADESPGVIAPLSQLGHGPTTDLKSADAIDRDR